MENKKNPEKDNRLRKLIKKFGVAGFIFFSLKGIAWLFIFYFGAEIFQSCE